jgi:sigma-B regulation protein RsbU (phosphoserine phosphatase)
VPKYNIASRYRPGQQGLDVGGDFYDVFHVDDRLWAALLGDVMGKGAEAAAMTALARHTARAAAIGADSPLAVLAVLNQALYRENSERFCTAAIIFVDIDGNARMATGGHPPPLVRRRSGAVEQLMADGTILGPWADWHGSEAHTKLQAGDLVMLYSDGVVEARRGTEEFGLERLTSVLSGQHADVDAAADAILAAVAEFATSEPDDVALIALHYLP